MTGLSGAALEHFERLRKKSGECLTARGSVCVGSGSLSWSTGKLTIHTDYGPADQDKDGNQDFALAWVAADGQDGPVRWAIALADGVTSSWYAEYGAEIACWTALAAVAAQDGEALDRVRKAVDSAGETIGAIGDIIEAGAEAYLPAGEFPSTWKFTLREGLLLQTTLCLAWREDGVIHLAFIGDGGAVIQRGAGKDQRSDIVGDLDEETNRVHALGPRNRQVTKPDVFCQFAMEGVTRIALFTDGVGRGLHPGPQSVFDEADEFEIAEGNVAKRLIERWISRRSEEFEDNLSLALVTDIGSETKEDNGSMGATVPC